jgi:hypothetical protein
MSNVDEGNRDNQTLFYSYAYQDPFFSKKKGRSCFLIVVNPIKTSSSGLRKRERFIPGVGLNGEKSDGQI